MKTNTHQTGGENMATRTREQLMAQAKTNAIDYAYENDKLNDAGYTELNNLFEEYPSDINERVLNGDLDNIPGYFEAIEANKEAIEKEYKRLLFAAKSSNYLAE
jgi:hypothetical protein